MDQDDTYRAYLMGTANTELEASIEEGLIDGRIEAARLSQIEDEMIDDLLLGRLSIAEERLFRSRVLCSSERTRKLEFARALQQYAVRNATPFPRPGFFAKLWISATMPWVLPLAGAFGCAVLTVLWFSEHSLNQNLHFELAQAMHANDDQQRKLALILEEQRRSAAQYTAPARAPGQITGGRSSADQAIPQSALIRLSPGVSRGLSTVPVLHLHGHASSATLLLGLPFEPAGALREELQNSAEQMVWKQEFSVTSGVSTNGFTMIVLPVALLPTGEYRLRLTAGVSGEHESAATYLFRVRKD